jgi:hypothetical protein
LAVERRKQDLCLPRNSNQPRQREKPFQIRKEQNQDYSMRRLQGPAVDRLGEEGDFRGPLRIVSGLAENTNAIICDSSSELEAANGCPVLREAGTTSREAHMRRRITGSDEMRALLSAPRNLMLFG